MSAVRIAAAALLAFAACGCVVQRLPPALSDADRAALEGCRGSGGSCALLGIDGMPKGMLEPLRETGLFREVSFAHFVSDIPRADWYLKRDGAQQRGGGFGPHAGSGDFFVLLLTLGIVPNVRTGDREMRYVLSRTPGGNSRKLAWDEPAFAMMGWLAVPLGAMPGMMATESDIAELPEAVRRDAERLALEICRSGALGAP